MDRKFYKELWKARFNKMLDLEKHSISTYESLLRECRGKYRGHAIEPHLEKLIADEKKHVVLVEELLDILKAQSDKSPDSHRK